MATGASASPQPGHRRAKARWRRPPAAFREALSYRLPVVMRGRGKRRWSPARQL